MRCFGWNLGDALLCKRLNRLLVGIGWDGGERDVLNALGERKRRLSLYVLPRGAWMIREIDELLVAGFHVQGVMPPSG